MQNELDEIDKEIESVSHMLAQIADDKSNLRMQLTRLGKAYDKRYKLTREPDDIQKVIEHTTNALAMAPKDDPGLPDLLSDLGIAYTNRFQRLGDIEDIEKSIEYKRLALAMLPDGHPELPRQLGNLALSHKERFERLSEPDDIAKAIEYDSRALAVTPEDHTDLPGRFEKLGTSYNYRFHCLGELDDIGKAIEYQSRGVELAPDGYARLPAMLANLAASYYDRFQRLNELNDLEKAIESDSRALALAPDGYQHLSTLLTNLGTFYGHRFYRLGGLGDLDKAIEYQTRTLALTPDDHPHFSFMLDRLAVSHGRRFQRLGEMGDLDKAIKYESRALATTPHDDPHLSSYLYNLAVFYTDRFKRSGELNDLEKAIKHETRALALTPDGHSFRSIRLANLGVSHSNRFERLGERVDLDKAIEYGSRALGSIPDGHPLTATYLTNLSASYNLRFQLLGDLADLEKAIEFASRALELTAEDHPNTCLMQLNLAKLYVHYYEHSNNPAHLQDSLHRFRVACESPVGAPRDRFDSAREWAIRAAKHSSLNCIEAYQTVIDLLPQFVWLGATTTQRYEDLKLVGTLALDAATAAILTANYPLALELLEHSRCVVWNQNIMLQSPFDRLQASHPSLATRLQTAAKQLHNVSSESRESSTGSYTSEQVAQNHHRLAKEYDELLTQARKLHGFEDFLRPIKATELVGVAKNGPVVTIHCHEFRCDVLVILPKESNVAFLRLPNFTGKKARNARSMIEASLKRQGLRERGVRVRQEPDVTDVFKNALAMIWNDLIKPTLEFLGYMDDVPVASLPHITWCPTGAASFLPLHAAGDYDLPDARVFNYVVSSYTPTLTALLASTPSALISSSQMLAIGQEATPGHKPLPGTKKELAYVKSHVEKKAGYSQLIDDQATPLTVLNAMEQHDWVHLACHAHQNVYDPTKSGFFLHEGTLDLAAISRRSFKKKGLAFLSACQTATGDETLPDEAVHLASGMLMAGYSSVIATMWSVVDEDAPFVADKVYSQLMVHGKLGNGEAGKALHNAVAGLRTKVGEQEFGRWVPYIHIGS
ncbi:aromatic di-alanine and TPR containing protein [Rhizoctonia solani AG-3 Rhs1AP]|uniref:Aromatic di-alanine and TPR containing protein n=1 Tax=Rhizoctonia solani AG-3 Rhs1AP TaxID=1086054 RepID=X8JGD3_9AGAM|nr:aromatic di-alanine and TPR containing protein [Rhizoctonia solani AG-3 Rhs1AP]